VRKIESNLFGGFDVRDNAGKVERCEKTPSGKIECRVVQEGQQK
jgi:hypothetical protein